MLYDNPLEILEAMGFDGAFGMREWFGRFHVEDLQAIAQALFHMQCHEHVTWEARSEEASYLFEQELKDAALDLAICYRRALLCHEGHFISPSYYTFGVNQRYILEKVEQFFTHYIIPSLSRKASVEAYEYQGESHLKLQIEASYLQATIVRLPMHYVYPTMGHIRADLQRVLHEAIRAYAMSSMHDASTGKSVRAWHWEGIHFVDALWGITEEHDHSMSMR